MAMLMGYPQFCTQDTAPGLGTIWSTWGRIWVNFVQCKHPPVVLLLALAPKLWFLVCFVLGFFGFFFRFWNLYDSFLDVAMGFPYSSLLLHFCDFLSHLCLQKRKTILKCEWEELQVCGGQSFSHFVFDRETATAKETEKRMKGMGSLLHSKIGPQASPEYTELGQRQGLQITNLSSNPQYLIGFP